MSDKELLRLLDSCAEVLAELIKRKRAEHLAHFEAIGDLEDEITPLSTLLGSIMAAARDIRSGGSRKDTTTGHRVSGGHQGSPVGGLVGEQSDE